LYKKPRFEVEKKVEKPIWFDREEKSEGIGGGIRILNSRIELMDKDRKD
jgi:hypothetical protein